MGDVTRYCRSCDTCQRTTPKKNFNKKARMRELKDGSDAHGTVAETVASAVLEEDSEDPLEISLPSDKEETVEDVHINPDLDSRQKESLMELLRELCDGLWLFNHSDTGWNRFLDLTTSEQTTSAASLMPQLEAIRGSLVV